MGVSGIFSYGLVPLGVFSVLLLAIITVYFLVETRESRIKNARYEAGNPPIGKARGRLGFQYLGYLILFATMEPAIVLLFILSPSLRYNYTRTALTLLAAVAVLLPLLVYGLYYSKDIERWKW